MTTSDPTPRLSRRGTIIRATAITVISLAILLIVVSLWVYSQAVKSFEVRRVSLPTRIFTDAYPLRAGRELTKDDLAEKLKRLGYRENGAVDQAGTYAVDGDSFRIFLRAFEYPGGAHKAEPVTVELSDGAIASVVSLKTPHPVETAALEPELLTSILGDQLENRRPITLDQVPEDLTDAVVVTEDIRFWQHPGVDPIGIVRAGFRNLRAGGVAEGGSTLTQQLVKNYYLTNERTMKRKVVEAFMAVILDAKYSKREILEAYLNDIYLGRNRSISVLGVGEAAHFYFGKPVSELKPAEAALIAGMIRSPNNYSPFNNPERARARRATVLGLMLKNEKITEKEYEVAMNTPLPEKPTRTKSGLSSIPYYVDRVLSELSTDYGIKDVKGRGYSIYTAIDLEWQDAAAQQIESGLSRLEKSSRRLRREKNPLQGLLISVDVASGEIRALVGGRDYNSSQFNRALQSQRQVGSLFKPFVYLAAFEPSLSNQNITPATLVNDTRFVVERHFGKDWSPHNYEEHYYGVVTTRFALEHSLNAASVRIGLSAGLDAVIKAAHALGVESSLESVPSIILGSQAVPPIEMAGAYSTIAREGSRVPLHAVLFVTGDNGTLVANGRDVQTSQVFPARDVYVALDVMKGVVSRGTAAGLRSLGFKKIAAGKTGTTNDKRDAWFIGFTPKTLSLVWVGFDDNTPTGLSGSDAAVPIWAKFMNVATAHDPDSDFAVPPGITFVKMDETTGTLASPECPTENIVTQAFKSGTEPMQACRQAFPLPMGGEFGEVPSSTDLTTTGTDAMPQLEGGSFSGQTTTIPETPLPEPIQSPEILSPRQPIPRITATPFPRPTPMPTLEQPTISPVPTPSFATPTPAPSP
ncbi:MAG: PBP1A family penicillin-binding protein [Acidobacteriota bacterium]